MVREVSERWLPQVAAEKVRKYETAAEQPKALAAADVLANVVSGNITKVEALSKARELLK